MINEHSRKYFNRAYASSSSALRAYALHRANHVQKVQECFHIEEMDKLLKHLKATNSSALHLVQPSKVRVQLVHFRSEHQVKTTIQRDDTQVMDAMFSFNS